jgi:hypothetical protein
MLCALVFGMNFGLISLKLKNRLKVNKMKKVKLFKIAIILTAIIFHGCGSGGGNTQSSAVAKPVASLQVTGSLSPGGNSYQMTENYGFQNATYMSATSDNIVTLRASIAKSMTDSNFTDIFRIDIQNPAQVSSGLAYVIGAVDSPVSLSFFDGIESNLLNTLSGTITFTSFGTNDGDSVAGSFNVVVQDGNSDISPKPTYPVVGSFSFVVGSSGPVLPTPSPIPVAAIGTWNAKCGTCHSLGSYDTSSAGGAPDISQQGAEIDVKFGNGGVHNNVTLTQDEIYNLKVLVNAY